MRVQEYEEIKQGDKFAWLQIGTKSMDFRSKKRTSSQSNTKSILRISKRTKANLGFMNWNCWKNDVFSDASI